VAQRALTDICHRPEPDREGLTLISRGAALSQRVIKAELFGQVFDRGVTFQLGVAGVEQKVRIAVDYMRSKVPKSQRG